jgi:hypothetical protein
MAAFFLGSVSHTLAELALAAGDLPVAGARAASALELHERLGWPCWARMSADLVTRVAVTSPR